LAQGSGTVFLRAGMAPQLKLTLLLCVSAFDGVCLLGTGSFLSRIDADAAEDEGEEAVLAELAQGVRGAEACAGGVAAALDTAALHACARLVPHASAPNPCGVCTSFLEHLKPEVPAEEMCVGPKDKLSVPCYPKDSCEHVDGGEVVTCTSAAVDESRAGSADAKWTKVGQSCNCAAKRMARRTGKSAEQCGEICENFVKGGKQCKAFTISSAGVCKLFDAECPTVWHPRKCPDTDADGSDAYNLRRGQGSAFEKLAHARKWLAQLGDNALAGASRLHFAVDPRDGGVLFEDAGADGEGTALYKWSPSASERALVVELPYDEPISGIAVGPDGAAYVAYSTKNCVLKFPPFDGEALSTSDSELAAGESCTDEAEAFFNILADPTKLLSPSRLALDDAGNIYVAEEMRARVMKFSPTDPTRGTMVAGSLHPAYNPIAKLSTLANRGPGLEQLGSAADIAVSDSGDVFVYDAGDPGAGAAAAGRVVRWAPGAKAGTLVASGLAGDAEFGFLGLAPDGALYATGQDRAGTSTARDLHRSEADLLRYTEAAGGAWAPETVVKVHAVNGLDVRSGTLVLGVGAGVTNIFQATEMQTVV